jgi:internalin A
MRALKILRLSWNPLDHVPTVIFGMPGLESISLTNCEIREIPVDMLRLPRLKSLSSRFNPVQSPPPEVANKGLNAIRDYWRQREHAGVDYLSEAKLIILGEGGAGKSSLAKKLKDPEYQLRKDEASTEGIDVIPWHFPAAIRIREDGQEKVHSCDFRASIWDFGGQEIYHATHQFFLTRRSLYVLLCDDRKEDTDFFYWLRIVEMLSDASPILIVQNEKQGRSRDINLSSLRAQFGNLKGAISTNLETNSGLDQVIQTIKQEI